MSILGSQHSSGENLSQAHATHTLSHAKPQNTATGKQLRGAHQRQRAINRPKAPGLETLTDIWHVKAGASRQGLLEREPSRKPYLPTTLPHEQLDAM